VPVNTDDICENWLFYDLICMHVCFSAAELSIADRRQKKEIRHLEQELPKWQVLVDSVTGK